MADDSDNLPPQGRFHRFRKLAGLTAQLGGEVLGKGARRLVGAGDGELLSRSATEKLVETLGDLKGAAMKFGQMASMDPDLLPPELRSVVARLQNQAPPMGADVVERVIREELGESPETRFASFDRAPMAAASLGQVHRARLHDGREVVVKVQYPGVDRGLKGDLENLGALVRTLSLAGGAMDGTAYFKELRDQLLLELDYRREARLADGFRAAVAPIPELRVPQVIEAHSADRVLALELLEGPTLQRWLESGPSPEARLRVSRQLVQATFGPFLLAGRVHADPHPGNYLVMPDGKLGVLDFGAIKQLEPEFVDVNRRLIEVLVEGTRVDLVALSREAGFEFKLPDAEAESFLQALFEIVSRPVRGDDYDYSTDATSRDVRDLYARNVGRAMKIRPPTDSVFFFRAVSGLGQNLKAIGAHGNFREIIRELLTLGTTRAV